jgi:hypothetical protein
MKWDRKQTIAMRMRSAFRENRPFPMPARPPVRLPVAVDAVQTHATWETYVLPEEYALSRGLTLEEILEYVKMGVVPWMPLPRGGFKIPVLEADKKLAAHRRTTGSAWAA